MADLTNQICCSNCAVTVRLSKCEWYSGDTTRKVHAVSDACFWPVDRNGHRDPTGRDIFSRWDIFYVKVSSVGVSRQMRVWDFSVHAHAIFFLRMLLSHSRIELFSTSKCKMYNGDAKHSSFDFILTARVIFITAAPSMRPLIFIDYVYGVVSISCRT